jgi:GGDEF domain-containing protein
MAAVFGRNPLVDQIVGRYRARTPAPAAEPETYFPGLEAQLANQQAQPRPASVRDLVDQQPSSMLRRGLGDTALSLGKGVIDTGEAAVGLADIPTLGGVGDALQSIGYDPKAAKEAIDRYYSPEFQAASDEVAKTQGFFPSIAASFRNPSTIVQGIAESAPAMLGGGAISQGLVARGLGELAAGAIGEGAVQAGQSAEQTRQNTGTLTPTQAALAVSSGAVDAALVKLSGHVADYLGIADKEVILAGGHAPTVEKTPDTWGGKAYQDIKRVAEGFLTEGVLQELPQSAQEQIHQNIAEDRPWNEGVTQAAVQGGIAGAVMGAGFNVPRPEIAPRFGEHEHIAPMLDKALAAARADQAQEQKASAVRGLLGMAKLQGRGDRMDMPNLGTIAAPGTVDLTDRSQAQANLEDQAYQPLLDQVSTNRSQAQQNLEEQAYRDLLDRANRPVETPEDLANRSEAQRNLESQAYDSLIARAQKKNLKLRSAVQQNYENQFYANLLATPAGEKQVVDTLIQNGVSTGKAIKVKDEIKAETVKPTSVADLVAQPTEAPEQEPAIAEAPTAAQAASVPEAIPQPIPVPAKNAERWQLTRDQFAERFKKQYKDPLALGQAHRDIVTKAIAQGLPVPAHVRAEYSERAPTSKVTKYTKEQKAAFRKAQQAKLIEETATEEDPTKDIPATKMQAARLDAGQLKQQLATIDTTAARRPTIHDAVGKFYYNDLYDYTGLSYDDLPAATKKLAMRGGPPSKKLKPHELGKPAAGHRPGYVPPVYDTRGKGLDVIVPEKLIPAGWLPEGATANDLANILVSGKPYFHPDGGEQGEASQGEGFNTIKVTQQIHELTGLTPAEQEAALKKGGDNPDEKKVLAALAHLDPFDTHQQMEEHADREKRGAEPELRAPVGKFIEDNPDATRKEIAEEAKRLRTELDTDKLTGLGSRRAMERSEETAEAVAVLDGQGLGWWNKFSLAHGDRLLKGIANAMRFAMAEHPGTTGFRFGGDEFAIHGPGESLARVMDRLDELLGGATFEVKLPNGTKRLFQKVAVDSAIGDDRGSADKALAEQRKELDAKGLRARKGERPAGLVEVTPGRITATGDAVPGPSGAGRAPEAPQASPAPQTQRVEPPRSIADLLDTSTQPIQRPDTTTQAIERPEPEDNFLQAQKAPKGFGQAPRKQFSGEKLKGGQVQGLLPGDIAFAGANIETKVTPDKTKAQEQRDLEQAEAEKKADAAKQQSLVDESQDEGDEGEQPGAWEDAEVRFEFDGRKFGRDGDRGSHRWEEWVEDRNPPGTWHPMGDQRPRGPGWVTTHGWMPEGLFLWSKARESGNYDEVFSYFDDLANNKGWGQEYESALDKVTKEAAAKGITPKRIKTWDELRTEAKEAEDAKRLVDIDAAIERQDIAEIVGHEWKEFVADDGSPPKQKQVPATDWPHLYLWDWNSRSIPELEKSLAEAREFAKEVAAAPKKKTKGKGKAAKAAFDELDRLRDRRNDPVALEAALKWAREGGAERYPVPQVLIDADRLSPGDFPEYEDGRLGNRRVFFFDIDGKKAAATMNVNELSPYSADTKGESGGSFSSDMAAYGSAISETGYRSLGSHDIKTEGTPREVLEAVIRDLMVTREQEAVKEGRRKKRETNAKAKKKAAKAAPQVEAPAATPPAPAPAPAPHAKPEWGAKNTITTQDEAAAIRKRLLAKFNKPTVGVDPEMMIDVARLGAFHLEAGARSFASFAKAMVGDLGAGVKAYLRGAYEQLRYHPAMDAKGMTPAAEIDANFDAIMAEADNADANAPSNPDEALPESAPEDGMGEEGVRAPAGQDGGGVRQAGGEGEGPAPSGTVRPGGPAANGARGDNASSRPGERPGTAVDTAGSPDTARGGAPGQSGIQELVDARAEQPRRDAHDRSPEVTLARAQKHGDTIGVIPGDRDNIRQTLPILFEGQQDDVHKAETRFAKPDGTGTGFLFTNGTGTGKTLTGLGIAKRLARQGKSNILILTPNIGVIDRWKADGKLVNLPVRSSEGIHDGGAEGEVMVTTYANFYQNNALGRRKWDLVIADESHTLSSDSNGGDTQALDQFRATTLHPDGWARRTEIFHPEQFDAMNAANKALKLDPRNEVLQNAARHAAEDYRVLQNQMREEVQATKPEDRTRTVMLSATPFAYDKSIRYVEGYLFDYVKTNPNDPGGYNQRSGGYDRFMMEHFGYRMRYNKLTQPDSHVDSQLMERQFAEWLRNQGSASNRSLDVPFDYDRKFILVNDAIGQKIDEGIEFLRSHKENDEYVFWPLYKKLREDFTYQNQLYLLEALKARHAVDYIKKSLALKRKVIVFHDFHKGGGFHPFNFHAGDDTADARLGTKFNAMRPDLVNLDFDGLLTPLEQIKKNFPGVLVLNGKVSTNQRQEAVRRFNAKGFEDPVIIVQSMAGGAGVSLHDIFGGEQRTILDLGLPTRPVMAIQKEGRAYRVGQQSDAIFRYMNTGTNFERTAFANKVAERAATVENMALGDEARALRDAFIESFEDSGDFQPEPGEGKGGKARDRVMAVPTSAFEKAKTFYFATQKRRSEEGKDYFATPEPVGLKMVQWLNIRPGDKLLEPSAGHGAIARFMPEGHDVDMVEPSPRLAGKAKLSNPEAHIHETTFENFNIVNKYDGIVMNPPFGFGGKTAIEHLEKAVKHLRDGGRIVALIPEGPAADKRWSNFFYSTDKDSPSKGMHMVAEFGLPTIAFDRAGTKVKTRIVVLEKQLEANRAAQIEGQGRQDINGDSIAAMFDSIEHRTVPDRVKPVEVVAPPAKVQTPTAAPPADLMALKETTHSQKKIPLFVATMNRKVSTTEYSALLKRAKSLGGWYSSWKGPGGIPGFQFESKAKAEEFMGKPAELPDTRLPDELPDMRNPRFDRPAHLTEEEWKNYNGVHDDNRGPIHAEAIKNGQQIIGAPAGVRIVDFEGDATPEALNEMKRTSAGLADRAIKALRMIANAAGHDISFGGFSPAGNMRGLFNGGKVYANYLAIHELATDIAAKEAGPYSEHFAGLMVDTLIHEAAHAKEAGHGAAFHAEVQRIADALGPTAKAALMRDFQKYAESPSTVATMDRTYNRVAPRWAEGVASGKEAAGNGLPSPARGGDTGAVTGEDSLRPSVPGEAGDRRESGLRGGPEAAAGEVGGTSDVREADGRLAPGDPRRDQNFRRWFGDSKIVDESGKPKVLLHGTNDTFTRFDLDHKNRADTGWLGTGVYLSDSPGLADAYSRLKRGPGKENIMPMFVKIENPYYATGKDKTRLSNVSYEEGEAAGRDASDAWARQLKARGHDGVILKYDYGDSEYVVFDPAGVKSATGNQGTFDVGNQDIRFQRREDDRTPSSVTEAANSGPQLTLSEETFLQKVGHFFQDKFNRVTQVQKDVEKIKGEKVGVDLASTFHGISARAESVYEEVNALMAKPITDFMGKHKLNLDLAGKYAYAIHAPDADKALIADNIFAEAYKVTKDKAYKFGTKKFFAAKKTLAEARAELNPNEIDKIMDRLGQNPSGMGPKRIAEIKAQVEASGKAAEYEQVRKMILDIYRTTTQIMVSTGLESQETVDGWAKKWGENFVHLKSSEEDTDMFGVPMSRGVVVKGKESLQRKGRRSEAGANPLEAGIQTLQKTIIRADRNDQLDRFAWWVEKTNEPALGEVRKGSPGKDGVGFKKNGVQYSIDLADKRLRTQLLGLDVPMLDFYTRFLGGFTRWMSRMGTVYSPPFLVKNPIRDTMDALLTSFIAHGVGPGKLSDAAFVKIAKSQGKAIKDAFIFMKDPHGSYPPGSNGYWFKEAKDAGAIPGFFSVVQRQKQIHEQLVDDMKDGMTWIDATKLGIEETKAAATDKTKSPVERAFNTVGVATTSAARAIGLKAGLEMMMNGQKAMEMATRANYYRIMREAGKSKEDAAVLARNLTVDFNKKGEWTPAMAALWTFFNPSVQGTAKLFKMVTSDDAAVKMRAQATMAGLVGAGVLWDVLAAAMTGDKDDDGIPDSDQLPDWAAERSIVLPAMANLGPIMIPLAQGYSVPFFAGQMLAKVMRGTVRKGEAALTVAAAAQRAFDPIGTSALIPSALVPAYEIAQNRDWRDRPVGATRYPGMEGIPDSQLALKRTPGWARALASGLNTATGGTAQTSGLIDVAPTSFEHYLKAFGGGAGTFLDESYSAAESVARGKTPDRIPFKSAFFLDPDAGQQSQFYNQMREMDTLANRVRSVERNARVEQIEADRPGYEADNVPLQTLRRMMGDQALSPELSKQTKEAMDDLDARRLALKKEFDFADRSIKALNAQPQTPQVVAAKDRIYRKINADWHRASGGYR